VELRWNPVHLVFGSPADVQNPPHTSPILPCPSQKPSGSHYNTLVVESVLAPRAKRYLRDKCSISHRSFKFQLNTGSDVVLVAQRRSRPTLLIAKTSRAGGSRTQGGGHLRELRELSPALIIIHWRLAEAAVLSAHIAALSKIHRAANRQRDECDNNGQSTPRCLLQNCMDAVKIDQAELSNVRNCTTPLRGNITRSNWHILPPSREFNGLHPQLS